MGDISRHRDIFLFTRDAVPAALLDGSSISRSDLSYVELGNYLTDVSQFRDPVTYIFTKQRIWREKVIPRTAAKLAVPRAVVGAVAAAVLAGTVLAEDVLSDELEAAGFGTGALLGLLATLPTDLVADLAGADEWIDAMFGNPLDRSPLGTLPGAQARRDDRHYGLLGRFFEHFIEGVTQYLFAQEVRKRVGGEWGQVQPVPETRVTEVYAEFFTQYFPHEHTDQPPYEWDAGKRPRNPLYRVSGRQGTLEEPDKGVMAAVDTHDVEYLAEGLGEVEQEWLRLRPGDVAGRQRLLVRTGKLLHGVEDWFFHSNVVELLALRGHRPRQEGGDDEAYLRGFVEAVARTRPEFRAANKPEELVRLKRRLYRRLRYPAYDVARGPAESGGVPSRSKPSTPNLRHAYPAFPSQQDTAHTLLHALENLGHKLTHPTFGSGSGSSGSGGSSGGGLPEWVPCVFEKLAAEQGGEGQRLLQERARARGVDPATVLLAVAGVGSARPQVVLVVTDVLREWVPLFLTLLSEDERQRLVANVAPGAWPLATGATPPPRADDAPTEIELQQARHEAALKPRPHPDGHTEDNYARLARLLVDCGFLNDRGRAALVRAFEADRRAESMGSATPGCGSLLMEFGCELQARLDEGDRQAAVLDQKEQRTFETQTDNGAFQEIVGSHSLMSKDTTASVPFFDDARVLATVASSSVLSVLLRQVSAPVAGRRLDWVAFLRGLIRFPPDTDGWERHVLALVARPGGRIPAFEDVPELARLLETSTRPTPSTAEPRPGPSKREQLEELYRRLEPQLGTYR